MTKENNEEIQLFDDDSKAFKLLYNELKDTKNVVVKDVGQAAVGDIKNNDDYLLQLFTKVDNNKKTYLHYTHEDLTENDERLRRQIRKVEEVGFKNKVVLPFEGLDNKTMEERYAALRRDGTFIEGSDAPEGKGRASDKTDSTHYEGTVSLTETKTKSKEVDRDDERHIKGNKKEFKSSRY